MAFTKFSNLDYDQIRQSIRDYLRANSNFTGFDFEGSNFSVLIDTLAYNAYINSVNANLIVNESFIDSATVRKNVVSLAGNIGYLPRSKTAAVAKITFTVQLPRPDPSLNPQPIPPTTVTLQPGLVAVGSADNSNYVFSIPEPITAVVEDYTAQFGTADEPIEIFQGTYVQNRFTFNGSLDQRFIINNSNMDYSTLLVTVANPSETTRGNQWNRVDNIIDVGSNSEIYYLIEVEQEKYELIFGDGVFGKSLENEQIITASYLITDGSNGNGPSNFAYSGVLVDGNGFPVTPANSISINTIEAARNGGDIETVSSIKYYAPRLYSAQNRAVTSRDYEAIVKQVYPNTESISVVGGEELNPPQFGNVIISIKPINGTEVSDFDKRLILDRLKQYSIAGINQQIIDLKIIFVELESFVYYDTNLSNTPSQLRAEVINALEHYSTSPDLSRFGGRFKYSRAQKVIDEINPAITSNITRVIIRRNLNAVVNAFAQYELCYGNAFYVTPTQGNIKSSGFTIAGNSSTCFLLDRPNLDSNGNLDGSGLGTISIVSDLVFLEGRLQFNIVVNDAGVINYNEGEITLTTVRISGTSLPNDVIEIQAYPLSNDVIGLKDIYVQLDVSKSKINMVRDTISSGEQISGVGFQVTSSYGNGNLTR